MTRFRFLLLAPGLLAVAPAEGQQAARSGGSGFNSNAPVDVDADRIEVQDRADRAIFSGNVVARQGNMTLNSARLTVIYTNTNGVDVQRLEATGGVTIRTPSETAQGNVGLYDVNRRLITLIGGVHLTQGQNRVQGGRLVLDLNTHRAVMDGGSSSGRVSGRFTVPQRQTTGGTARN
ncbi:lipopolysaccharide transport periplasmic protein LptA [Allosphingosinicella sp.]|uniref:lipopolysaccharide transport periplasmic protein LptA n=1 Tax=Allosphingosinicella sp. TaxID=2823234 RepID=UPI003783A067